MKLNIHKDLKICKICNKTFSNNIKFCSHLFYKHKINLKKYIEQYFNIPICKYCRKK